MTAAQYKSLRQKIGTQTEVAMLLGVTRDAIAKRESGANPVTREAEMAIKYLGKNMPEKHKPPTI